MTSQPPKDARVASETARLAEFAALRAEIDRRSTAQQALIGLNLTATAAIATLVTGNGQDELLLVLALVSPTLGSLWVDHARNIEALGKYISDELFNWSPCWERSVPRYRERMRWRPYEFVASMLIALLGPPWGALTLVRSHIDGGTETALFAAGMVFTASYTVVLGRFLIPRWLAERRAR